METWLFEMPCIFGMPMGIWRIPREGGPRASMADGWPMLRLHYGGRTKERGSRSGDGCLGMNSMFHWKLCLLFPR